MFKIFCIRATLVMVALLVLSACSNPEKELSKFYQGSPETKQLNQDVVMPKFAQTAAPADGEQIVIMETSKGTIRIRLFPELAPKTVENFVGLIEKGYY